MNVMTSSSDNTPEVPGDRDQEICLCFHVTRRKIENFIRIERPRRAAQLAECFGAGTGCGWCRKYLVALFQAANEAADSDPNAASIPTPEQYRQLRGAYHRQIGWQPDDI